MCPYCWATYFLTASIKPVPFFFPVLLSYYSSIPFFLILLQYPCFLFFLQYPSLHCLLVIAMNMDSFLLLQEAWKAYKFCSAALDSLFLFFIPFHLLLTTKNKQAKIPESFQFPDCGFCQVHDCRHSYASSLNKEKQGRLSFFDLSLPTRLNDTKL